MYYYTKKFLIISAIIGILSSIVVAEERGGVLLDPGVKSIIDVTWENPENGMPVYVLFPEKIVEVFGYYVDGVKQCDTGINQFQYGDTCYEYRCPIGTFSSGNVCQSDTEKCIGQKNYCVLGDLNEKTLQCEVSTKCPDGYKENTDGKCEGLYIRKPDSVSNLTTQESISDLTEQHLEGSQIIYEDKVCTGTLIDVGLCVDESSQVNVTCDNGNLNNDKCEYEVASIASCPSGYSKIIYPWAEIPSPYFTKTPDGFLKYLNYLKFDSNINWYAFFTFYYDNYWPTAVDLYVYYWVTNKISYLGYSSKKYTVYNQSAINSAIENKDGFYCKKTITKTCDMWDFYCDGRVTVYFATGNSSTRIESVTATPTNTSCPSGYLRDENNYLKCDKIISYECPVDTVDINPKEDKNSCMKTLYCANNDTFEEIDGEWVCTHPTYIKIPCPTDFVYDEHINACVKNSIYKCE